MPNDPIPVGATGTVTDARKHGSGQREWFQVDVQWDNGRTLMLAMPPDRVEVFSQEGKEEK